MSMADALWRARAAQRMREEESRASREASEGALVLPIYAGRGRRLRRGALDAWSRGEEHGDRVSPFGAHRRTPGVRRSAHFDALKWHIWLGFSSWRYNKVC